MVRDDDLIVHLTPIIRNQLYQLYEDGIFSGDICREKIRSKHRKQFQYCSKVFSNNGNRVRHEKTHTGKNPLWCEECHKQFTQKSNLNAHIRSVHRRETCVW